VQITGVLGLVQKEHCDKQYHPPQCNRPNLFILPDPFRHDEQNHRLFYPALPILPDGEGIPG
jgi:hypothetical protein